MSQHQDGLPLVSWRHRLMTRAGGGPPRERGPEGGLVFLRGRARPATEVLVRFISDDKDPFGVEPACRVLTRTLHHGNGRRVCRNSSAASTTGCPSHGRAGPAEIMRPRTRTPRSLATRRTREVQALPSGLRAAGLAARMIAACIPSATAWVGVISIPTKPTAASPARYSANDSIPATNPVGSSRPAR
jgi:hypothetical protein